MESEITFFIKTAEINLRRQGERLYRYSTVITHFRVDHTADSRIDIRYFHLFFLSLRDVLVQTSYQTHCAS